MDYEQLQAKFQDIQNKSKTVIESAIRINSQIENSQITYQKMQEAALKKFGTNDIEELKKLSAQWKEQNTAQIEAFDSAVNKIIQQVTDKTQLIKQIQQS